jgi:hypothetical protein
MAYQLALPPTLAGVHNTFLVSMIRKYIPDPSHVIGSYPIELKEDLTYEEQRVKILDTKEKKLSQCTIKYVKVQWSNHTE